MLLLGLDVETTGVDREKDYITEIGAVLWDTDYNAPVDIQSYLLNESIVRSFGDEEIISPYITKLTGIDERMLAKYGCGSIYALSKIQTLYNMADYIVAHNAIFDLEMFASLVKRTSNFEDFDFNVREWIDTCTDLPIDRELCKHSNLLYLAAYHGIINPFSHRAVTDVLTMLTILSKYSIDEVLAKRNEKKIEVYCFPGFHGKDAPKAEGFKYNGDDRSWRKVFAESDLDMEKLKNGTHFDFEYKWEEIINVNFWGFSGC